MECNDYQQQQKQITFSNYFIYSHFLLIFVYMSANMLLNSQVINAFSEKFTTQKIEET